MEEWREEEEGGREDGERGGREGGVGWQGVRWRKEGGKEKRVEEKEF